MMAVTQLEAFACRNRGGWPSDGAQEGATQTEPREQELGPSPRQLRVSGGTVDAPLGETAHAPRPHLPPHPSPRRSGLRVDDHRLRRHRRNSRVVQLRQNGVGCAARSEKAEPVGDVKAAQQFFELAGSKAAATLLEQPDIQEMLTEDEAIIASRFEEKMNRENPDE